MRIGLYGMPTAGKSYILEKINFMEALEGSKMLREICPDFDRQNDHQKGIIRRQLADTLEQKDSFIMDGHYVFGDQIVFTESDGRLYDVFLYLYISPDVLKARMDISDRNKKYLKYDVESWQRNEIEALREYCHRNDKDFYVVDNPPENVFVDISEVIAFIKAIVGGYSCLSYAKICAEKIMASTKSDTVTLMDGDKTITIEDSSHAVFDYSTHLYDGNFYTGYQSWKQTKEFEQYDFDDIRELPVDLNETVCQAINSDTFILTSGHERVWCYISNYLKVPFYYGVEMSAETKFFITKLLQKVGKRVIAYGDGMNDYYMLKQSDQGYLIAKTDGTISRSLKNRDLGGIVIVRT